MATSPSAIRSGLVELTSEAAADLRAVAAQAPSEPQEWRAELFAAAPLIVAEYAPAASELALGWFEEIRFEAAPRGVYTPTPRLLVTDDDIAATVARTTEALKDFQRDFDAEVEQLMAEANANLEAELGKIVAAGFRDTITGNADDDPDAVGWRRFTRDGGCKFCRMLADRGAVFTERSVHFAAHTHCNCVTGQSYDPNAPRADVMQYVASRRNRSAADRARLRNYLNQNFPDAHG